MLFFFSKTKLNENKYLILGHLTFLALLVFSFIFAKERVIYIDSGAQIFEFTKDEWFHIYVQRYSMYLSQLLPVLAVNLHLPLLVVIYAYSISMPLIGYILWLITVYFLKNQKIGILLLFVMLGIRQTFFHAISETFQLMFYASFLYVWLFQTRNYQRTVFSKTVYYLIASLFIALCIFIHPVAIFFIFFILGLYILTKDISIFQKVIISMLSMGMILLKLLTTTQGSHDAQFMISRSEFFDRISRIFTLNSTIWFINLIKDFYWIPLLMLIISLLLYLKQKKYWRFAFVSGFVVLFWVITVVVYASGDSTIGMERSFLPLFFLCGTPFVVEFLSIVSSKWNMVFFMVFTVLLVFGFKKIAVASAPYTQRLEKIEQISVMANQTGEKKILIDVETAKQIFPTVSSWGLGFESMILSSLKGVDATVNIFMVESIDPNEPAYADPEIHFAVPWWRYWEIDALNPHYFQLPKQLPVALVWENGEMRIKDL
jgi:hypothetical protein